MKKIISLILSLVICLSLLTSIVSAAENPFTDVKNGKFYYDAVLWAVQKEITTGTTATTFSPDTTCTRGQVVTFLWRAFGSPEPTKTTHPYTDVKETAFYYKAMLWAVENGITSGMTPTTFEPGGNCTRGQVVTFLHRAAGKVAPTKTTHPFTDVKETAFYYQAMLWAVENGITSGMTSTTFVPGGNCTRGQVVTFLYRTLKDGIPEEEKPTECSHKYDNACDAQCNVCGETRTPAAHIYNDDLDTDCNVCGAARYVPMKITLQPTDVSAMIGDPVVFTVVAEGGKGSYTYQWQYMSNMQPNWLDITDSQGGLLSGYQSADLQVSVISDHYNDCYQFRCIITDSIGNSVTSDAAAVTEFVPLTIYTQPEDLYVSEGTDCEFRILVGSGLPTYTYQWYWKMNGMSNAIPFDGSEGLNAKGYNTDTLTFNVSQEMIDNETFVFCTVTDQTGTEVTSQRAYLVPPYGCYMHSGSHGAEIGEVVDISVYICGGKAPYTYQWQRRFGDNGTFKNYGAAVVSYELEHTLKEEMTPEILDMLPQYQCIITDANGYVAKNSKPICIWEYKELTITSQPKNAENVSVGDTVTFTVEATSSDLPIQYQWYSRQVNGYALFEAIEGATDASYTHTFTEADRKYNVEFYCSVWDFNGHGVVSDTIRPTYSLWIKSQSKTEWNLQAGKQQTFLVTPAGGTGKYTYSWEICDTMSGSWHSASGYSWIDSASAKTFALKITPKNQDASRYEFRCKVSDGVHTITCDPIRINVQ